MLAISARMRSYDFPPSSSSRQKSCSPARMHTGKSGGVAACASGVLILRKAQTAEVQKPTEMSWPQYGSSMYLSTSAPSRLSHSQPVGLPSCFTTARHFAWNLSKDSLEGIEEMPCSPCKRCSPAITSLNAGKARPGTRAGGADSTRPATRAPPAPQPRQSCEITVPKEWPRTKRGTSGLAACSARSISAKSATMRGTAPSGPAAIRPRPGEPSASAVRPWPRASCATTTKPSSTRRAANAA
mmetsp:Transcript_38211/g.115570  ORF Transcript_38211/g.115570 Transcript_38211/m.115570 type:complete len:242 (-) Transcript_38211:30-755(-)